MTVVGRLWYFRTQNSSISQILTRSIKRKFGHIIIKHKFHQDWRKGGRRQVNREQGECRLREFKNNRDQTTLEYQENVQFENTFSNKGWLLKYKILVNPFRAKDSIGITTSRRPKTKYVTLTKHCLVIEKG